LTAAADGAGSTRALLRDIGATLHAHWRALLIFHLLFGLFAATLLAPLATSTLALVGTAAGGPTLTVAGLAGLALAPAGWAWLAAAAFATILAAVLQQAGMIATIAAHRRRGPYRAALAGLWQAARRTGRLSLLALMLTAALAVLTLPVGALLGAAHSGLSGGYEAYDVGLARPTGWAWFVAIACVATTAWLVAVGWLYLRSLLALPLLVGGGTGVVAALRTSATLMRASGRGVARLSVGLAAGALALPPLVAAGFDAAAVLVFAWLPQRLSLVVPIMLVYMTLVLALALAATFAATALHAALLDAVCRQRRGAAPVPPTPSSPAGRVLWSAEALLLLVALAQAAYLMPELAAIDGVRNIAHRGSPTKAPENTVPAIEQALADGADAVEVDVRRTSDGQLVLWHDRDLRRLGMAGRAVADVTLDKLRALDLGAAFGERSAGVRVATLGEAIDAVRGRADLLVDVKSGPQAGAMAEAVVDALRSGDMLARSMVASMHPAVLAEVRRHAPALTTVQLAEFIVGTLDRSALDVLALRRNRVSATEVARARRHDYALYVWTVNDPAAMDRFISLGVDGIITDRPDMLARRLAARADMSAGERLLVRLRDWHRR